MNPKIKNAIVFILIGTVMFSIYIFFIKKSPEQSNLITSSSNSLEENQTKDVSSLDPQLAKNFLDVLLNVKNISLDDAIFSDIAFANLRDSSIILTPDGKEGRPNPFAPLGVDNFTIEKSILDSKDNNTDSTVETLPSSSTLDSSTQSNTSEDVKKNIPVKNKSLKKN